jgi:hypothetical protein
MSVPTPAQAPNAGKSDLRPAAVLAIGFTGHRDVETGGPPAEPIRMILADLLKRLSEALRRVAADNAAFFSASDPTLRAITMAADGADLIGAEAARAAGLELACVLPFPVDEYQKDFAPASGAAMRDITSATATCLVLPGTRHEGARVYERANDIILAHVDLLIAVWDGERAHGRAGTGDVVQSAVNSGIPIIVIDPRHLGPARLLRSGGEQEFERPVATDLKQDTLPADLTPLVARILAPPPGSAERSALSDFYADAPPQREFRIEYPMLLKLFGVAKVRGRAFAMSPAAATTALSGPEYPIANASGPRLSALQQDVRRIDDLAVHYAQMHRSSATSGYLIIIVVALLSASIGFLFPKLSNASIVVQMAVNGLILIDARIRSKRRWLERWLDYRSTAERLRSLRFLHPLGLVTALPTPPVRWIRRRSWVDWYIRRMERGLGPPNGAIGETEIVAASRRLIDVEIPEQLNYHRRAFKQLGRLERRLSMAATITLFTTVAVAASLWTLSYFIAPAPDATWKRIVLLALAVFPAATSAFNGIRADADLVRLVERSALATISLTRLRRALAAGALVYDRLATAAARTAVLMADELSEWRYVLETRRGRQSRRNLHRRRRRHFWR